MAKTITIRFMRNDKTITNSPEPGTKPIIAVTMRPSAADNNTKDIGEKQNRFMPSSTLAPMIIMWTENL